MMNSEEQLYQEIVFLRKENKRLRDEYLNQREDSITLITRLRTMLLLAREELVSFANQYEGTVPDNTEKLIKMINDTVPN